jgi:hypothetical protein
LNKLSIERNDKINDNDTSSKNDNAKNSKNQNKIPKASITTKQQGA